MNRVKDTVWIILGIAFLGYFCFLARKRWLTDHIRAENVRRTKAVIINHRNYNGNSPVKRDFTYSYSFIIHGQVYTGDSHDPSVNVGDSVEVEYDKNNPTINKPMNPKE